MRSLCLLLLLVATPVFAQPDRYELGRHVIDFEVAWDEKADDAAAKRRAAPLIAKAVQSFFQLKLSAAGKLIDEARHALESAEPASPAVRWADSLQVVPESRVVDASSDVVRVTVKSFYPFEREAPKGAKIRMKLGAGKPLETALDKLPTEIDVPIKNVPGTTSADFTLVSELIADGKTLARKTVRISRIEKFADRLAAVKKTATEVKPETIEDYTFLLLVKQLESLARKTTPETDLPASRLIFGAERLATVTEPYYLPKRPGEFWLSVPTGTSATVVRIRIPPKLEEKKGLVPVLFALHGMGGSENLFFDSYGNGIVPRLATERGWIVVAPRVEGILGAGPAPKVAEILDQLAKRYPIDPKRVYLVGHSMGAGHALQVVQKDPRRYAAVAALGGGGRVTKGDSLKGTRFFVGCGKMDFALAGARALYKSLEDAKVAVTFKEYDDIEHLLIVRESAEDVFKFFEGK